jgi:ADP-heptose:LPS heptosyltransferase
MAIIRVVKALPVNRRPATLVIIKTDEIGDYVLFHAYLKYFRQSEKYRHHRIVLVGNAAWRQLYEAYDAENSGIDEVIWLNKKQLKRDLRYRFSVFRQVRAIGASDTVNCIFSRSMLIDDGLVYVTTAVEKTAMEGDNTNRGVNDKDRDCDIYTSVIDAGDRSMFDAIRNRNFVSLVLKNETIKPETRISVIPDNTCPTEKYFMVFLGAGNPERKWPAANFAGLATYVNEQHGLTPLLCGGPDDIADADAFCKAYGKTVLNYTAKTTLVEMTKLLAQASFLVCVDTGILHIAAAVGCPVIGLYSGKFYGRFGPYPSEIATEFYPIYPDFADKMIEEKDPMLFDTFMMRNDTIREIGVEKVKKNLCSHVKL